MSAEPRPPAADDGSSRRVRLGLKWVSLSLGLSRLVRFGTTALLTWFLARELFGLVTIANAVINVLASLREMGFGQAYIQRRDADEEDARRAADTTFALSLGTNLALMGLAYLLVPAMARIYQDAEGIGAVLRVMLLAFLIDPFSSTPAFVLQKRLDFRRISISEIWASLSNAAIAVALAYGGAGVWSLVAGQLGSRVLQAVVLWRAARWRPRVAWSPPIARELFGYGKYLWGFSALSAVGACSTAW